jgi:hypothetical protein
VRLCYLCRTAPAATPEGLCDGCQSYEDLYATQPLPTELLEDDE